MCSVQHHVSRGLKVGGKGVGMLYRGHFSDPRRVLAGLGSKEQGAWAKELGCWGRSGQRGSSDTSVLPGGPVAIVLVDVVIVPGRREPFPALLAAGT